MSDKEWSKTNTSGTKAAMPQFNEGHWEKKPGDINTGGSRYASEMNTENEYQQQVNALSAYVKSHKAKH